VAFLQLEPSFRHRFSKYPKPKRGIGPSSLKTGAKEGYRPRSSRTRSQKVVGSQGYKPRSKETRCQKGVNGFSSSNNRSHTLYLGFEIREPFFLSALAPLSLSASTSPPQNLSQSFLAMEWNPQTLQFLSECFLHTLSPAPEPRRHVDASDRPNYGLVVLRLVAETSVDEQIRQAAAVNELQESRTQQGSHNGSGGCTRALNPLSLGSVEITLPPDEKPNPRALSSD